MMSLEGLHAVDLRLFSYLEGYHTVSKRATSCRWRDNPKTSVREGLFSN